MNSLRPAFPPTCALCCSARLDILHRVTDYISEESFTLFECRDCGLVVTWPQPAQSELRRYYPESYYAWEPGGRWRPMGLLLRLWDWARQGRNREVLRSLGGPG